MKICDIITEKVDPRSSRFKAWFGKSKVVDKNGEPLLMYHGTSSSSEFNKIQRLSHFGTLGAASNFVDKTPDEPMNSRIFPVYLRIENPIRFTDDPMSGHHPEDYADIIAAHPDLPEEMREQMVFLQESGDIDEDIIVSLMGKYGYDGFVYANSTEDMGSTSWVITMLTQVLYLYADK